MGSYRPSLGDPFSELAAAAAKLLQSCPTVRPQRRQPIRFPHPWDSPGKNTGVGCHFLLQCMKVKNESEVVQSCPTCLTSKPWAVPLAAQGTWDPPFNSVNTVSVPHASRAEDRRSHGFSQEGRQGQQGNPRGVLSAMGLQWKGRRSWGGGQG